MTRRLRLSKIKSDVKTKIVGFMIYVYDLWLNLWLINVEFMLHLLLKTLLKVRLRVPSKGFVGVKQIQRVTPVRLGRSQMADKEGESISTPFGCSRNLKILICTWGPWDIHQCSATQAAPFSSCLIAEEFWDTLPIQPSAPEHKDRQIATDYSMP